MVPRVSRPGRSFAGAWAYYFHDKRSLEEIERGEGRHTAARVAWHHTENLAGLADDRAAVGLMIDTAKQSKRCEKPVYAFSLAWHPDEKPEQAHMIEAGRSALKALGMQDHQALMVAHTDTAHPHVHVIVNRVHPETGKAINLYKDQEKLQAWALAYERTQGKVYCRAREFRASAREMTEDRARAGPQEARQRPQQARYVDNTLAECWTRSDSGKGFQSALAAKGWKLAKGDRKDAVLMAVTPSGRAFAVLRELNKGLPKGQKLTGADMDRKLADLNRGLLPSVEQAQQQTAPDARRAFRAAGQTPPTEEEARKRQAQDTERRARFEEHAARERQKLFSRQLEDRDALHLGHAHIRKVWVNRVGAPCDQRRREIDADLRALAQRQAQTGLKAWLYRLSGQAEADRAEQDALNARQRDLARELAESRERMETPLRAEVAALGERQDAETRELDRQLAERWERSWNRADRPVNENTRTRDSERKPEQSHGRGGRSRSRDYD